MRLSFSGDILVEKEQLAIIGEGDYYTIIAPTKSAFQTSDLIVGNLETPIANREEGYTNHMWSFNTPVQLLSALKAFGFNLLTTANNHCLDRGIEGLKQTIRNLNNNRIRHTGTRVSSDEKNYCEIEAVFGKIAIFAYTYGTNASLNNCYLTKEQRGHVNLFKPQESKIKRINKFNILFRAFYKFQRVRKARFCNYLSDLKKEVRKAREAGAKIIIMCLHISDQYSSLPSKETYRVIKWMLDNGIDYVIGNHEHVIHPIKIFGSQLAAYSLGNFTATPNSESTRNEPDSKKNKTEYSIILHIDIDDPVLNPVVCFQITKIITGEDGISRTFLLYDLICNEKDPINRQNLINDNEWIVRKIFQKSNLVVIPQSEYKFI